MIEISDEEGRNWFSRRLLLSEIRGEKTITEEEVGISADELFSETEESETEGGGSVDIVSDEELEKQMSSFLVYDTGLALDHALRLGRSGRCYYFVEYRTRYPRIEDYITGYGFESIVKVLDWGEVLDLVDTILMVDVGFGALNQMLRKAGKFVFGSSPKGDMLELDRVYMIKTMRELGIKTPNVRIFTGVDSLLDHVVDGKKQFLKLNIFRGNLETCPIHSKKEARVYLEQANFGAVENELQFLLTDPVEGVEIGVDAFFNGKEFVRPYNWGNEIKGTGGQMNKVVDSSIWDDVLNKMEPWLAEAGYRGNISFEGIFDGSDIYVIDVTSRLFFPGSSIYPRFIENYAEVIAGIARGEYVEPRWETPYNCLLTAYRSNADVWTRLVIDDAVSGNVAYPRGAVYVDGENWIAPGDPIVATIMGGGNSLDEAFRVLYESCKGVSAVETTIAVEAVERYLREYQAELERFGITW